MSQHPNFMFTYCGLKPVYQHSVLNVTALVGAFSVIVKTDGSFAAQLQVCSVVELEVREPLT